MVAWHLLSATKKIKSSARERAVGNGEVLVFSTAAGFRAIGGSAGPDKKRKREREKSQARTWLWR